MDLENEKDGALPKDHPRYQSLTFRHQIIEGMKQKVVAEAGLIAHGRGECFDYIIGEKTTNNAEKAIEVATALFLISDHPVISVNGNVAALIPEQIVKLSQELDLPLEINLFYRKEGRIEAITDLLRDAGATNLLGTDESKMIEIAELSSNRRKVDPKGIYVADTVFVPLEDGDRTEALKKAGKKVITVDLNPISRTALWSDVTIVDNIIRAVPKMIDSAKKFKDLPKTELKAIFDRFDNRENIRASLDLIKAYIERQKTEAFRILDQ